ncbi:MAG: hypothetical protein JWM35_2332 [Verrucomicrobia bacterium]|nr:hypothetical protein [Verrucomicrobiota bacterium]
MKLRVLAFFLCMVPLLAPGAESGRIERDLGQGLAYVRVRALPADLPGSTAKSTPFVLDLRYAGANETGVTALGAWLQFHSSLRTPVFVLVNASTASAILDFLETTGDIAGLITLGGASSHFVPDVPLKVSAATERSAYDALEHGTAIETLLTDQPGKVRHDEASIAQERTAEPDEPVPGDGDVIADVPEVAPTPALAPRPLIDATLQRAVHLHRTLLALRRI